jgi:hypothetical protein
MQFLYPQSRQFPFDEAGERIVRALHARDWKVPGFVVTFYDYGSGDQKLRHVADITSDQSAIDLGQHDVKIHFGRVQGRLPGDRLNDLAAIDAVRYGSRLLRVYGDESGPTFNVYVGDNWERDRATYWDHYNAKLEGCPRKCLRYSGRSGYQNSRAASLDAEPDHREYGPVGDEPISYDTSDIMQAVRSYLQDVILPAIEAYPVVDVITDVCAEPFPIPFPSGFRAFFAYGNGRDARRIALGKNCLDELQLSDRYGMRGGNGYRLAPLGIKSGADLPEVAYDGFLWCGVVGTAGWRVPGCTGGMSDDQLIKVTPKNARGIYVADHAAYEKRREILAKAIKGKRDRFTDEEVADFTRARARTIVSILDYKGDYEDPVYLINRELALDEVEVIGSWPQ